MLLRPLAYPGVLLASACATLLLLAACESPTHPEPGPPGETRWTDIAAGAYFNCGLTDAGVPHCWGFFSAAPGSGGEFAVTGTPTPIPGAPRFQQITVGGGVGCGLDTGGRAYCWGQEHYGELGNGGSDMDSTRTPVPIGGELRFRSISAGYTHTCAVTLAGEAYCWGDHYGGRLGDGISGPRPAVVAPHRVAGDLSFASISAGTTQTCGTTTEGRLYCWGGGYGAAGVSPADAPACGMPWPCDVYAPRAILPEQRFLKVSAGNGFTCAVTTEGHGYCWGGLFDGAQKYGVLGNGSTEGSAVPVAVAGGHRFTAIYTGTRAACGITIDGAAYCWGGNSLGELGIGTVDLAAHPGPVPVKGGLRFRTLALGDVSCGITTDSEAYCWGVAGAGQLGNGETRPSSRPEPTRVSDPELR